MARELFTNISGWTKTEFGRLMKMVEADGVDRSKFIRGLVREEWRRRQATTPSQINTGLRPAQPAFGSREKKQ